MKSLSLATEPLQRLMTDTENEVDDEMMRSEDEDGYGSDADNSQD